MMKKPIMPIMPEQLKNAMPTPIPQLEYGQGILKGLRHNINLGQIEKASEREAKIAENKNRLVRANLDSMNQIITFSTQVQDSLDAIQDNKEARKATVKEMKARANQEQIKALLMQQELKSGELDLQAKIKQMEEEIGTDEDEDRDE